LLDADTGSRPANRSVRRLPLLLLHLSQRRQASALRAARLSAMIWEDSLGRARLRSARGSRSHVKKRHKTIVR